MDIIATPPAADANKPAGAAPSAYAQIGTDKGLLLMKIGLTAQ